MNDELRGRGSVLRLVPLIASLCLGSLVPGGKLLAATIKIGSSNTESMTFAVYNTTAASNGNPTFSNGLMTSVGSSLFPSLTSVNGTAQNFSQTKTGAYTNVLSANQNPPFGTSLPATFGAATFSTSASTALANGGSDLSNLIGVSFNSGTFLQSASTMTGGIAAVSFGHLDASFSNSSAGPGAGIYKGTPGAVISASGVLSPTVGSFVELANQGTITIKDNNGNLIATDSFSTIVAFGFGPGLTQEESFPTGILTSFSAPNPQTGAFTLANDILFPAVSIPEGGSFSVDSTLTLVSDPGSLIQLSSDMSSIGTLPNFGSFLGGPAVVPEPYALVSFGTGMCLVAGFWGCRRSTRRRRALGLLPRWRSGPAKLLVLPLGLLVSGMASAGTITVNDTIPSIPVNLYGFATTTLLSKDPTLQKVTFDGTYFSTGGDPAPGNSVTYTVVFLDPNGAQSDATTLTIGGLANPTSTQNTSVNMTFQGIVTTPIAPGTGVFLINEPMGWFDVAAYLRNQGAQSVPGDLSVLIASAVPEPSSMILGGIALLAGAGMACRRRLRPISSDLRAR